MLDSMDGPSLHPPIHPSKGGPDGHFWTQVRPLGRCCHPDGRCRQGGGSGMDWGFSLKRISEVLRRNGVVLAPNSDATRPSRGGMLERSTRRRNDRSPILFAVPYATSGPDRNPLVRVIQCENAFSCGTGTDSMTAVVAHPRTTER